jgi:endonuclease G
MRSLQAANEAEQGLLDALLAATADTAPTAAVVGAAVLQSAGALLGTGLGGAVLTFSGPVTIQLPAPPAAGSPVAAPAIVARQADADVGDLVAEERALVFDSDYGQRPGYDQNFLGMRVPLPSARAALRPDMYTVADYKTYYEEYRNVPKLNLASMKDDDPLVLDYHHFSLAFHKKYRMCLWTASNCDYRPIERQDRRKRAELGGENWQLDPRVPAALQLTDADVYRPLKRIDRGHIVRREDNAWGTAGLATEYANSDTYHWTNCTPQHEAFNQAHPQDKSGQTIYQGAAVRGVWGQFEGDLALAIKRGGGQATVFAGPLLKEDGDAIDWGNGEVAIPKRFWKVFVVPETTARRTRLLAYAYIFDQTPAVRKFGLTYEGVELPQFVRNRVTLAEITEQTGVLFAAEVLAAEKLASPAVPA